MSGKKGNLGAILAIVIGFAAVGGLTVYALQPQANKVPEQARLTDESKASEGMTAEVKLLRPNLDDDLNLTYTTTSFLAPADDAIAYVLNDYLTSIPSVTSIEPVLWTKKDGSTLIVEFDPDFVRGYGTEEEMVIVNGILASVSQFDGIQQVAFNSEGKPVDSLGNISLLEPQPVSGAKGLPLSSADVDKP